MKNYVLTTLTLLSFIPSLPQIIVNPGDNIQSLVDANSGLTTFTLKSGVHRLQSVTPKSNNIFIGEDGAIMSGARILDSWYQNNGLWIHDGQDQSGQRHGECASGITTCKYPEDLFMDNILLEQVDNLSDVTNGKWYFDYDADKIYIIDDPSTHLMEISTSRKAFANTNASNVTIQNLIIEKYAIPAQMGAIGDQYPGEAWIIEDCESRFNHGVGIKVAGASIVRNCHIHHNGQLGIGAIGTGGLIDNNEINENLTVGYNWGWEGGASKFQGTDSLIVRNNYVHHNNGPGLWTDINNIHTTYEYNLVEYNLSMGIFHEISYDAIIRCNTVRNNSTSSYPWLYGSQILISTSQNTEVYDNNVTVDASGGNGITILNQDRGSKWYSKNNYIHDNDITYLSDKGVSGCDTDYDYTNFWASSNNAFDHNRYHVSDETIKRWRWKSGNYSWASFNDQGQGLNGSVDNNLSLQLATACAQDNFLPTVTFITPFESAIFKEGQDMGVIIDASDIDGWITQVELYMNDILIRSESNAPYEWGTASINDPLLSDLKAGNFELKAVATDNQGGNTTIAINVIVNPQNEIDCFEEQGGNATIDNCAQCVEGNTGLTACTEDCNGDWGGTASIDNCIECSGGNTGKEVDGGCILNNDAKSFSHTGFYPNPAFSTIKLTHEQDWSILNRFGVKILSGTGLTIQVNELNNGVYFLKLGNLTSKFIKL